MLGINFNCRKHAFALLCGGGGWAPLADEHGPASEQHRRELPAGNVKIPLSRLFH